MTARSSGWYTLGGTVVLTTLFSLLGPTFGMTLERTRLCFTMVLKKFEGGRKLIHSLIASFLRLWILSHMATKHSQILSTVKACLTTLGARPSASQLVLWRHSHTIHIQAMAKSCTVAVLSWLPRANAIRNCCTHSFAVLAVKHWSWRSM